jgi:hypothetical protein
LLPPACWCNGRHDKKLIADNKCKNDCAVGLLYRTMHNRRIEPPLGELKHAVMFIDLTKKRASTIIPVCVKTE